MLVNVNNGIRNETDRDILSITKRDSIVISVPYYYEYLFAITVLKLFVLDT